MKCEICGVDFDAANLSSVMMHQHSPDSPELAGAVLGIKGKKVEGQGTFDLTFSGPSLDDQIAFINDERGTLHLWLDMVGQEDEGPTTKTVEEARKDLAMYTAIQDNLTKLRTLDLDTDNAPVHFEITWSWIWRRATVAAVIILILIWLV